MNFWRAYWLLAREHAPELEMREPAGKSSGSTFVLFRPPALPHGVDLCHKLTHGYVDLQLRGMGDHLNAVHAALGPHLVPGMRIARVAKSAAVRLITPELDMNVPLEAQRDAVLAGLESARQLLRWFVEHQSHLVSVRL